jgi:ubiquinone/menaquinone biosynthesis C-methylase UbiE
LKRWSRINLTVGNAESLPVPDESQDAVTSIFLFHELPPKVRRIVFRECARALKPGGRLVLVDSLQRGDQPDYEGLLELFPQNYHEPYYRSYTNEDFGTLAAGCGLTHIRDVKAFVSKVWYSTSRHAELHSCRRQEVNRSASDDSLTISELYF